MCNRRTSSFLIVVLSAAIGTACASLARELAASDASADVSTTDGTERSVAGTSFAREVFPIVKDSCAIAGCHNIATQQNHWSNDSPGTADTGTG